MLLDHEVPQQECTAVVGETPSKYQGDDHLVGGGIIWLEADVFCNALTQIDRRLRRITSGEEYRLPTEAEWEYAARAGKLGIRYGELDAIAWCFNNVGGMTHPVKQKAPNAWGFYDILGNVSEWCEDWWERDHSSEPAIDPRGPSWGTNRVIRGGHWDDDAGGNRAASRIAFPPHIRHLSNGFRPVLSRVR